MQLFVDRQLVDRLDGVQLKLHSPQPQPPVFTFDAAWEGPMSAYVTVLEDAGKFRMYYRGGGEWSQEVTCLATSDDAIHWKRPNLGLFEFNGSRDNNIIYRGQRKAYRESHNFTPFIDQNPAARPEGRYKAVALGRQRQPNGDNAKTLVALRSPDGIHWQKMQEEPIITQGSLDSQCRHLEYHAATTHTISTIVMRHRTAGTMRSVLRTTSTDFLHWTPPQWLHFGDTPLEQFYVNTIGPYFREPSLLFQVFRCGSFPREKPWEPIDRATDGISDAVLISSRDGLHFERTFMEAS